MMTDLEQKHVALALGGMIEEEMKTEFVKVFAARGLIADNLMDAAGELAASDGGDFGLEDALRPALAEWVRENRAAIIRRAQELAGTDGGA